MNRHHRCADVHGLDRPTQTEVDHALPAALITHHDTVQTYQAYNSIDSARLAFFRAVQRFPSGTTVDQILSAHLRQVTSDRTVA